MNNDDGREAEREREREKEREKLQTIQARQNRRMANGKRARPGDIDGESAPRATQFTTHDLAQPYWIRFKTNGLLLLSLMYGSTSFRASFCG